jgi:ABC-2 type transport system ATP-binding protein
MTDFFSLSNVTKQFGAARALDGVSLRLSEPSIVGLVGKNGSGKTTLLRHVVGLHLPTSGSCTTFGRKTVELDAAELVRIGMAHQHDVLLGWMKAGQLLRYVATFYKRWDTELEQHLVRRLEIDETARVLKMSPGNRQKLSIVLAVCHHPALLLLDEPLSDLDPIVRREVVEELLDRFRREEMAIVISSHLLHDLERIVDRVVCLDQGKVVADSPLDELKDQYGANLDQLFRQLVGAGE